MKNLKDKLSSYSALILVIVGALNTFLQVNAGQPIKWDQLVLFIVGAVTAYLTGKNPDGSTKSAGQINEQNAQSK